MERGPRFLEHLLNYFEMVFEVFVTMQKHAAVAL